MQYGFVGLVTDRAEDALLAVIGITHCHQGLIAMAGEYDLIELFGSERCGNGDGIIAAQHMLDGSIEADGYRP